VVVRAEAAELSRSRRSTCRRSSPSAKTPPVQVWQTVCQSDPAYRWTFANLTNHVGHGCCFPPAPLRSHHL